MTNEYRGNDRDWQVERMRRRSVNYTLEEEEGRLILYYQNKKIELPMDISFRDRQLYGKVFANYLSKYSEEDADLAARYFLLGRKFNLENRQLYSFANGCMLALEKGLEDNSVIGFGKAYAKAISRGKSSQEAEMIALSGAGIRETERVTKRVTTKKVGLAFTSLALATLLMSSVVVGAVKAKAYFDGEYTSDSIEAGLSALPRIHHTGVDYDENVFWYDASDAVEHFDPETMNIEEYIYGIYEDVDANRAEVMDDVIRCLSDAGYLSGDIRSFYEYCLTNGWVSIKDNEVQIDTGKMKDEIYEQVQLKNQLAKLEEKGKSK